MKKYQFMQLELTNSEKIWLGKIYSFDFKSVDEKTVKISLADSLEKGFDQKKIDNRLLHDNRLTLIGIWYVDCKSKYFDIVTKSVYLLKDVIKNPNFNFSVDVKDFSEKLNINESELSVAFSLMMDVGIFSGGSYLAGSAYMNGANISDENGCLDKIIHFTNIYEIMEETFSKYSPLETSTLPPTNSPNITNNYDADNIWICIKKDYSLSKREFGKRINFIKDNKARKIIFRDIEHTYFLLKKNINKSSIILAGSVMEEILRQLLLFKGVTTKNTFDDYIKTCERNELLSDPVSKLSDCSRIFRNYAHIARELKSKEEISNSAVSSLFVLVSGLKNIKK